MAELAGARERVTSLFAGGYIIESEFASAKAGILGAPLVSNTEMDLEGWNAIEQFPFKSSKEIVGAVIAYKFDAKDGATGWARGTVKSLARTGPNASLYGAADSFLRFAGGRLRYGRHLGSNKESGLSMAPAVAVPWLQLRSPVYSF